MIYQSRDLLPPERAFVLFGSYPCATLVRMAPAFRVVLSIALFASLAAAIGWALGEFMPLGGTSCEPFSDCANDLGARYALYAAIAGSVLGVAYGTRGGARRSN